MKLKNITQAAIALTIMAAGTAQADQFAIKTSEAETGASQRLLTSLQVREIDAVKINGVHFTVIEARDEGYAEAYIYGQNISAEGLYRLEADWNGTGLSSLPVEAREPFLQEIACEFCAS
ncbi:hypothetical protein [Marimonas lutisalis]|uniref:hypothetical protein n=1 Tax=Marimonas lutisalis TaxID=2545756 RepID=UPI0010F94B81|nr:hypothetical protein [Marimonas lutisalis]